jgi:hypothetical protein
MKQHGGKRPGAGRPKGSKNKTQGKGATRPASAQASGVADEDRSPLQRLLNEMRQTDDDLMEMEQAGVIDARERLRLQAERNKRRNRAAKAAARFVHPRPAPVKI